MSLYNRTVWVIWDGAAGWAVRRMIKEGRLPALRNVAERGLTANALPPSPNCQTPPSLATLFTGTWPMNHGIHGFAIPNGSQYESPLTVTNGFEPEMLQSEPIWTYAGNNQRRSVLVHIPWVLSQQREVPQGVDFAVEGYSQRDFRSGVIVIDEQKKRQTFHHKINDLEFIIEASDAQVIIRGPLNDEKIILRTGGSDGSSNTASLWMEGKGEKIEFYLHSRSDGVLIILHTGLWATQVFPPTDKQSYDRSTGCFVGEGLGRFYRQGMFGPRLLEGGTGEAEQLLVTTIGWAADYFTKCSDEAVQKYPDSDLYMFYQPCIDDIEHEMMGWCDPESKAYQPHIADQIWDYVCQVYTMADRQLQQIVERMGDQCTVVVSSDHGMAGVISTVHVNEALQNAGLLRFNSVGEIDLTLTRIYYHPANNGSMWINHALVQDAEAPVVIEQAIKVIRSICYTPSGEHVIEAIYPTDTKVDFSGVVPAMGQLFLAAADGFELSDKPGKGGAVVLPASKSASHATNPNRSSLQGIFYSCGDRITNVKDIGVVDNRHLFSFICAQLGIDVPQHVHKMEGELY